jgi:hypothetical protein
MLNPRNHRKIKIEIDVTSSANVSSEDFNKLIEKKKNDLMEKLFLLENNLNFEGTSRWHFNIEEIPSTTIDFEIKENKYFAINTQLSNGGKLEIPKEIFSKFPHYISEKSGYIAIPENDIFAIMYKEYKTNEITSKI